MESLFYRLYNFFMDNTQILDKIIKPEFRERYNDWEHYAKRNEILGLECIGKIYSVKGNKKIRVSLPSEKQMYDTHESFMRHKSNYT